MKSFKYILTFLQESNHRDPVLQETNFGVHSQPPSPGQLQLDLSETMITGGDTRLAQARSQACST